MNENRNFFLNFSIPIPIRIIALFINAERERDVSPFILVH
jgi:hypothetical protein